jgi:cytochrome c oxidase subunit IV
MSVVDSRPAPGIRFYLIVWVALLLIVAAEVIVTVEHPATPRLLTMLLILAVIEAGLALMYFMHLRFEPRRLFWTLIPALVFVLVMMNHFIPDALRLMHQRAPSP